MICVGELKDICQGIEREWGSDSPVCIQFRDDDKNVIEADYVNDGFISNAGVLYLTNRLLEKDGKQNEKEI